MLQQWIPKQHPQSWNVKSMVAIWNNMSRLSTTALQARRSVNAQQYIRSCMHIARRIETLQKIHSATLKGPTLTGLKDLLECIWTIPYLMHGSLMFRNNCPRFNKYNMKTAKSLQRQKVLRHHMEELVVRASFIRAWYPCALVLKHSGSAWRNCLKESRLQPTTSYH